MDRRLLISLILNHLRTQQNRDGYVSLLKKILSLRRVTSILDEIISF